MASVRRTGVNEPAHSLMLSALKSAVMRLVGMACLEIQHGVPSARGLSAGDAGQPVTATFDVLAGLLRAQPHCVGDRAGPAHPTPPGAARASCTNAANSPVGAPTRPMSAGASERKG